MLQMTDIHKSYRIGTQDLPVLRGVDLNVDAGEFVSIMGSSGSGKSTLLNIMGVLDRHDSGRYVLDGQLIENLSESRAAHLRNRHIGFVFQSFNLIDYKSAIENVALPLFYQRVERNVRNRRAAEILEQVGLAERGHHLPAELSGGECQRVAIARALITDPSVILADEPTGALDSYNSTEVMSLFKSLHRDGKTIVVVTHENDIAAMTDRIIYMNDGRVNDAGGSDVQP